MTTTHPANATAHCTCVAPSRHVRCPLHGDTHDDTATTAPNAPYPDIAPPAGADMVDDWEGDPPYRVIFGDDRTVTDHTVRVYASVVQLADGTTDEGLIEGPRVYVADGESSGLEPLNSDQARELAAVLVEAAAEVDGWVNR